MNNHNQVSIQQIEHQTPTAEQPSERNVVAPREEAANPFVMRLGSALIQWDDPDRG